MIRADEIHARLGDSWPQILIQLGIPQAALCNRHGPCPACGGKDRFRFDNKWGRGDWFCNHCGDSGGHGPGAGNGFDLLMRVRGWTFTEARRRVIEAAGFAQTNGAAPQQHAPLPPVLREFDHPVVMPRDWVLRLRRECCPVVNCDDAVDYLASRDLWPLPTGCTLRAHATVEYRDQGTRIGRYPALL